MLRHPAQHGEDGDEHGAAAHPHAAQQPARGARQQIEQKFHFLSPPAECDFPSKTLKVFLPKHSNKCRNARRRNCRRARRRNGRRYNAIRKHQRYNAMRRPAANMTAANAMVTAAGEQASSSCAPATPPASMPRLTAMNSSASKCPPHR